VQFSAISPDADPRLAAIVDAWLNLPEHVRKQVAGIVRAAMPIVTPTAAVGERKRVK